MLRSSGNGLRTGRHRIGAVAVVLAALAGGTAWIACGPITEPIEFSFSVLDTSTDSLPATGTQVLYKYRSATVKGDSAIRALLNARIAINEAWEPKQDVCAASGDPIGPRFTVLIDDPDTRLENHGFELGNGIRPCTTRVLRYLIQRSFF
jgi:hypothetical protein